MERSVGTEAVDPTWPAKLRSVFDPRVSRIRALRDFMSYGHPAWAVLPLFLLTTLVAAIAGDLVARYFSEPVNRALRQRWSEGSRQLGSVSDS
jgi:hypothetical protein